MAGARGIAPIVDLGGGKILVSGGVATISLTSPGETIDVTYLSASEATFRFGTIAGSGGSIEINTRH